MSWLQYWHERAERARAVGLELLGPLNQLVAAVPGSAEREELEADVAKGTRLLGPPLPSILALPTDRWAEGAGKTENLVDALEAALQHARLRWPSYLAPSGHAAADQASAAHRELKAFQAAPLPAGPMSPVDFRVG